MNPVIEEMLTIEGAKVSVKAGTTDYPAKLWVGLHVEFPQHTHKWTFQGWLHRIAGALAHEIANTSEDWTAWSLHVDPIWPVDMDPLMPDSFCEHNTHTGLVCIQLAEFEAEEGPKSKKLIQEFVGVA